MIGIPLRVSYNDIEYMYYVLSPPGKKCSSFEILLEGKNHLLILDEQEIWNEEDLDSGNKLERDLAQLIGKGITQHYPIKKRSF